MSTCAYCDQSASTEDHVPAQALLVGVPRSARPRVPSCISCNLGASDDDEYFRDVVVKYHRVADQPEVQPLLDKMLRAARNPKKKRYAENTMRSFEDVRVVSDAGLDLGMQPAFRVDRERLERVAERYVRGLHFYQLGQKVPRTREVRVIVNPEPLLRAQGRLVSLLSAGQLRMIKSRVFWYKWVHPSDKPSASLWLMSFFDAFPVVGIVRPEGSDSIAA